MDGLYSIFSCGIRTHFFFKINVTLQHNNQIVLSIVFRQIQEHIIEMLAIQFNLNISDFKRFEKKLTHSTLIQFEILLGFEPTNIQLIDYNYNNLQNLTGFAWNFLCTLRNTLNLTLMSFVNALSLDFYHFIFRFFNS